MSLVPLVPLSPPSLYLCTHWPVRLLVALTLSALSHSLF
jgi:hypothetical protein